jgi:hypothetical protein
MRRVVLILGVAIVPMLAQSSTKIPGSCLEK